MIVSDTSSETYEYDARMISDDFSHFGSSLNYGLVIIPTYNEAINIKTLIREILLQGPQFDIVVIDDSSPDGTGAIVAEIAQQTSRVQLLERDKKRGLATAYLAGFELALEQGHSYVFEMDGDHSHRPEYLPIFMYLAEQYCDVVIGSRRVAGGGIDRWSWSTRLVSVLGSAYARLMLGMTLNDCTSGLKCFRTGALKSLNLASVSSNQYAYNVGINYHCYRNGMRMLEYPIVFDEQPSGASKINFARAGKAAWDIFRMRLASLFDVRDRGTANPRPWVGHVIPSNGLPSEDGEDDGIYRPQIKMSPSLASRLLPSVMGLIALLFAIFVLPGMIGTIQQWSFHSFITSVMIGISTFLLVQSIFTLMWMLSIWNNPEILEKHKSPPTYEKPQISFTALVPARHEEKVIGATIRAVAAIDYPDELKETLVLCRYDDTETIAAAEAVIASLGKDNIRVVTFGGFPINKPYGLNQGLSVSKNEFIGVFDAEDEPHSAIYNVVNTVVVREQADVIQAGVQLMNLYSTWFSALNVLEYFFWFKSGLRFFTTLFHVTPLGGNTVFVRKTFLKRVGGWDHFCLTEDADLGIRLTTAGARIRITYDERHATQEETPLTTESFIKQRTRWNQGFLQVLAKGDWRRLPRIRQKLLACYVLLTPVFQASLVCVAPLSIIVAFTVKMPVIWTIYSFIPLGTLFLQYLVSAMGLLDFAKGYNIKLSPFFLLRLLLFYYPYQITMALSAFRAVVRIIKKQTNWEKTKHSNAHRPAQSEPSVTKAA